MDNKELIEEMNFCECEYEAYCYLANSAKEEHNKIAFSEEAFFYLWQTISLRTQKLKLNHGK